MDDMASYIYQAFAGFQGGSSKMAVGTFRIRKLEQTDCQICHIKLDSMKSTDHHSRIGHCYIKVSETT